MEEALKRASLRARMRLLARDSVVYGGALAVSRLAGLITFPMLTRHFSVPDYGLVDAFNVLVTLLTILSVFGQDSAHARYFYEYESVTARREMVTQSLVIQVVFSLIVLIVLSRFAPELARLFVGRDDLGHLPYLVIALIPFSLFLTFSQGLLRWTFKRAEFLFISLGNALSTVGTVVFGILVLDCDVEELFWAYLAQRIVFGVLGLYLCRQWIKWPANLKHLPDLLRFGIPYGITCVLCAAVPTLDRSFISHLASAEALGMYAAGSKIALLITLPISAFQTAWGPFSFAIHKESDAHRTYDLALHVFTVFVLICSLSVTFLAEPLLYVLAAQQYLPAAVVVFPLAVALSIQAIEWITAFGIDLSKKTYLHIYGQVVGVIAGGISMVVLIPLIGIVGAAMGILIGYTAQAVLKTYLSYHAHPLRFSMLKPAALLVVVVIAGLAGTMPKEITPMWLSSLRAAIFSAVLVFVWFAILGPEQRDSMIGLLRRIRSAAR